MRELSVFQDHAAIVELKTEHGVVPARIWEGETESGIKVHAYVTRIAVSNEADTAHFDRELKIQRVPSADVQAIPMRLVL